MKRAIDGRDLLGTYQPGDSAANERIVRAYQDEILRACFLLTGDGPSACTLARAGYLRFFRALMRGDVEDDPREALLDSATRLWMTGDWRASPDVSGSGGLGPSAPADLDGATERYQVDDERSRVLAALERLSPRARAALVLRDFHALGEEMVCRILDATPHELRRQLQPARAKIREATGVSADHPAGGLLTTATSLAPRTELWPELEGPLDDLSRRERQRRQRYAVAAAALAGLALLAALLWFLDPFSTGDGEPAAAALPVDTPTPPAPTPTPEPTPTPIPDISTFDLPRADVPARLAITAAGQNQQETGLYDPASGAFRLGDVPVYADPSISPDGRWLIASRFDQRDTTGTPVTVIATNSVTGEQMWEKRIPHTASGIAMTSQAVYRVVTIDGARVLIALDLETGEEIGRWPGLLDELVSDNEPSQSVSLKISPNGQRLFIFVQIPNSRELGPRVLASYRLPDMTLESVNGQTSTMNEGQFDGFWFYNARVTPDGEYLYDVRDDMVLFRNADADARLDLILPFSRWEPGSTDDLRWIPSNEGRYLYIVALERQQGVIVDLLSRTIVRVFPIDPGGFDESGRLALVGPRPEAYRSLWGTGRAGITLSPDGSRLYIAGGAPTRRGELSEESSLIWVIDLATWRIIDRWEVVGTPVDLMVLGDALYARMFLPVDDPRRTWEIALVIRDAETGKVVTKDAQLARPEWADSFWVASLPEQYRATYGRLPAVEGFPLGDVDLESTLPRVEVAPSTDAVPAGARVDIEARAVDPVSGEHLAEGRPCVRFDPEATAVMRMRHEAGEAEDVILFPTRTEPGVYRASASIEQTGFWSVETTLTATDGTIWTVRHPRAFQGVPSFEATNGKRYILRVETEPAQPRAGREVPVRAEFVEINTGAPLPPSEDLLDGAPDDLRLSFLEMDRGLTSATLRRVEDGSYEGTVTFHAPGDWAADASFRFTSGQNTRIGAGQVTVRPG